MFGKLMKHEFRATGRIALPLCGVMLALSVITGAAFRFQGVNNTLDLVSGLSLLFYFLSIFAVCVGVFVVLMQHYKRNLLGDEGYLMRTLPVSVHELLLSKLFVALIWYAAAYALIALSFLLTGVLSGQVGLSAFDELWEVLQSAFSRFDAGLWICLLLSGIGSMTLITLLFYADFTITQAFRKQGLLYHVMAVGIFVVLLWLLSGLNNLLDRAVLGTFYDTPYYDLGLWIRLAELCVSDVALYFLTWAALKYHPNIE